MHAISYTLGTYASCRSNGGLLLFHRTCMRIAVRG